MASHHEYYVQETLEVDLIGLEAMQSLPQVAALVLGMSNPSAMLALQQHQLQQQMLMLQQRRLQRVSSDRQRLCTKKRPGEPATEC